MAHTLHTVILAGGAGTRFWPLSRELAPKQMLSVFGDESLIVQTILRAREVMDEHGTINIVVGEGLLDEVRNHLKACDALAGIEINYIVEPCGRNTSAALALAASTVKEHDSEGIVMMLPSDHLCEMGENWRETIAAAVIRAHAGDLVTIGLEPTRPETGYGYILKGDEVLAAREGNNRAAYKVEQFVEKPDAQTAQRYVDAGTYFWNSGMLVASARTIIKQLRLAGSAHQDEERTYHRGQIASVAETFADAGPEAYKWPAFRHMYDLLPSVPFDKAVLEVSDVVSVVPTNLAWSDVGSLSALEQLGEQDAAGNYLLGNVVDVESTNSLVFAQKKPGEQGGVESSVEPRLIATLGLDNALIVDTPDATLITTRDRAQDVRLVVDALKALNAEELVSSKTSLRPWGRWTMLVRAQGFHVKEVDVLPGKRLSLQSHEHRAEHWIVIAGEAHVTRGEETLTLHANESVFLPIGMKHRLENTGAETLRIVEVATGSYLGEDDITRYDDDFGR